MPTPANVTEQIFALSPAIRYVALYRAGQLTSQQRSDLASASASIRSICENA